MRVLFIHGVGHAEADAAWGEAWTAALLDGLKPWSPDLKVEPAFASYDDLFQQSSLPSVPAAIIRGLLSGFEHGVVNRVVDFFRGGRGLAEVPDWLHWHVGMVALWLGDEQLRAEARDRLSAQLRDQAPELVVAHSLGSLISYDALTAAPGLIAGGTYVTLGSQIGSPFVVDQWAAGRIVGLPSARRWHHLFNPKDPVLTAPLRIGDPNFAQVRLDTRETGIQAHDALVYLRSPEARQTVWMDVAGAASAARGVKKTDGQAGRQNLRVKQAVGAVLTAGRHARRRALLIGINAYPDPANQLDGCVNDAFLMSSVLQERGFDPEDIRLVLDERATAEGIRNRLDWLLDGVQDGDERFLFYSGHGAQIPIYGASRRVERIDECLVPWDFRWTPETAVTDEFFRDLYSQLPYGSRFVSVFDCCHSGGMTRGSAPKVRGLDFPDDIRHRMIRWDNQREMWVDRKLASPNQSLADHAHGRDYLGGNGATYRLGRAVALRTLPNAQFNATRKRLGHLGPYLPILLEACQQDEKAYEYRHGVTSYGAFTYSLASILRRRDHAGGTSFVNLIQEVAAQLKAIGFSQHPVLVGPKAGLKAAVPGGRSIP